MPSTSSLWTPRGGYGVEVSGYTHEWTEHWRKNHSVEKKQKSKVQLLKLHGSLRLGCFIKHPRSD